MKRVYHIYVAIAAILLAGSFFLVSSCMEFRTLTPQKPSEEKGIPVRFKVMTDDLVPSTKAPTGNVVGGSFGDVITSMQMLCFDVNGLYVGTRDAATVTSTPGSVSESAPNDNGTFEGVVPPTTARIHFIANVNRAIPGEKVGYSENQLMHDPTYMTTDKNTVAYWGYLKCSSDAELAAAMANASTTVYLLRDRIRIKAGNVTDSKIAKDGNNKPKVRWVVYGGQDRGMIAPYNANASNPFENYYTGSGNNLEPASTLTLNAQAGRYETNSEDLIDFDGSNLFAFEDLNSLTDPSKTVRMVVEVQFTSGNTKYFPVLLQKPDGTQLDMLRSHCYVLNIGFMPEAIGFNSFVEAATASSFANGQLVSIEKIVTSVSDGEYKLDITLKNSEGDNTTSVVYQTGGGTTVQIPFEYTKNDGVAGESIDIEATWVGAQHTVGELPSNPVEFNGNTSTTGYVKLSLAAITANLKSGTIHLEDKTHSLTRDIYVYSINHFSFAGATLAAGGTQDYRLTLTLPTTNEYPDGLYPMTIKIASKSLKPMAAFIGGTQVSDAVFGVAVESTLPGNLTGGVSGITAPTTTYAWNYQDPNRYWNFWYTYTLVSKPSSNTIWIDFDNISGSYSDAPGIGLYLKTLYFADSNGNEAIPIVP